MFRHPSCLPDSHKLKSRIVDPSSAGFANSPFAGPDSKRGKGKRPPVECVNAGGPSSGLAADTRLYYPCVIADRRIVQWVFISDFQICAIAALGSQKAASAADV